MSYTIALSYSVCYNATMALQYAQRAYRARTEYTSRPSFRNTFIANFAPLWQRVGLVWRAIVRSFNKRPVSSFFGLLLVILILIIIGQALRKPKPEPKVEPQPKQVSTFRIGATPKVAVSGRIKKEGIAQIVALTPGVVSNIQVAEGQSIGQGQTLVSLASNYQGSNPASIQRQLAQAQLKNAQDAFQTQKSLVATQRDVANRQAMQTDELRVLQGISNEETHIVINQNEDILKAIDKNIEDLKASNRNNANDPLIAAANQMKTQFLGSFYQLRAQTRTSEYNTQEENSPAILSDLAKEAALKQLDVQEKSLNLQLETAKLQTKLAQVNEASFFPTSPFAGTVDRVHVVVGQAVNPGTPLVTVHGDNQKASVVALVPQSIAQSVAMEQPATIVLKGKSFDTIPSFASSEATEGELYSISFDVPETYLNDVTDNASVTVNLPIAAAQKSQTEIFLPLDAVFQTENKAYVFVLENDIAKVKEISLGEVRGNFVTVTNGLTTNDEIIVNRTVVNNEKVRRL